MAEYVSLDDVKEVKPQKQFQLNSFVLPIIIINLVVFLLQMIFSSYLKYFKLNSALILERPWTIITAFFMHANPTHLLFNMYALFLFGTLLERKIGKKRFLFIYFASGILVSIISSFFYPSLLGASGAVMGIIGTLIIIWPKLKLYFFFIIPMELWLAGLIWFLLDFFGMLFPTNIAHIGHIVGMATGLAYGFYIISKRKKFRKKFSKKTKINLKDAKEFEKNYK